MKALHSFIVLCCLLYSFPALAQSSASLTELLERKNKTTHECVTAVFSPEEMAILRAHYGRDSETPVVDMRVGGSDIFGIENVSQTYGKFDKGNPAAFTPIADSPIVDPNFEGAGAVNGNGSKAYVVDNNNNLYELVLLTGVYTLLGAISGVPAGESITGLEFNPLDGILYALSTNAVVTTLLIINLVAIAAVVVGVTGMVLGIALAATLSGQFFALDIDSDSIFSLSLITGLAVLVGTIGFDANFGQGMALSYIAGVILLAAFNNTVFDSELRIVNIATGLTTLIGIILVAATSQFSWIGNPDPTLSVSENLNRLFNIYPNPAGDSIFLEAGERIESVSIFDMYGRRVMYQPVDATNSQLDISYLSSGQYLCSAVVNGQAGMYKIIKQ
ncbi:MAG: T9SS type A sorting domain-containing protein [Bacteroidia bacterium]|nr:T9SS type A sorting domain-containing protein [Bacteroidia bacterium]MBT8276953.1 T9SS type A sorting domain-containing protein [Bacteroidia bacterium]NNF31083.1 T9SS type A sorting domain-containing protein [Flavobacteriaceae bacterium]NNK55316.1 T9SS type A sorting domain-containing protein [Flavobacteriaceae bacterium]NNM09938.1 T9SS type A sorting domain-containing protein [Flavobacteriaceae bacterium]